MSRFRPVNPRCSASLWLATWVISTLSLFGCGQGEVSQIGDTAEQDTPTLPVDGEFTEQLELQHSIEAYLEPMLAELRAAGAHKPPGLWTTIKTEANPFSIPPGEPRWYKTADLIELDELKIRVFPDSESAEVSYVRHTHRGPALASEQEARESNVDWARQSWSARFRVTYDRKDGNWSCRQTDYQATVFLPDGRPGQQQQHSRPGIDFLRKELESIRTPVQAN